MQGLNIFVLR